MSECASEDELLDHIEGRASPERSTSLLEHADECGACRLALADLVADGPRLASHATLGRFVIVRCLGAGGMGLVYEAHDPTLDRKVALKVMHRGASGDAERVMREAQAMAKLSDPHVVHVYEVGVVDEQLFIAMELVDGETLADWLAAEPRTAAEIIRMLRAAGRGLAAAHAAGLVHRDFKPENVLVARSGRVLVGDFGLAAAPGATRELTGTLAYLAPEQLALGAIDARTDQFSFCVVLHEALHGTRPYVGASVAELRAAMLDGPPVRPPRAHGIPRRTRNAIARGLARSPSERFASMTELCDALAEPPSRRARIAMIAAAVLVLAVLAVGVGRRLRTGGDDSPPVPPGARRYEAEDARLLGPARINDNHPGASGHRFVDRLAPQGAGVEFAVEAAAAGVEHLAIRYADGGSSAKTATVYINDARTGRIETPMLPDWDTWGTIELDVDLAAGANRIAIRRDPGDSGGFNLDYIEVR